MASASDSRLLSSSTRHKALYYFYLLMTDRPPGGNRIAEDPRSRLMRSMTVYRSTRYSRYSNCSPSLWGWKLQKLNMTIIPREYHLRPTEPRHRRRRRWHPSIALLRLLLKTICAVTTRTPHSTRGPKALHLGIRPELRTMRLLLLLWGEHELSVWRWKRSIYSRWRGIREEA
jgi:hypothetical protein